MSLLSKLRLPTSSGFVSSGTLWSDLACLPLLPWRRRKRLVTLVRSLRSHARQS